MNYKTAAANYDRAISVGPSKDEWMQTALELFMRTNPEFDGYESNVEIIDADESRQEGQGQILARRDNIIIRVPFFINEGKLQPLDLFYLEDEVFPMSKERLDDVFFNVGESFGQVSAEPDNMGGPDYGPGGMTRTDGNPQIRSYGKQASALFDSVLGGARPEAVQASVERATQPQIMALLKAGRDDLFDKMASVAEVKPQALQVRALRVKLAAPGYYHVEEFGESRPGEAFPLSVRRVKLLGQDGPEYFAKIGQEQVLDVVDQQGWAIVPVVPQRGISVEQPVTDAALVKVASGGASLWRSDGKNRTGVVAQMHDIDGTPADGHIFIGDHEHALADTFFGESTKDASVLDDMDVVSSQRKGVRFPKVASWVWQEEDGSFHATRPFAVRQQHRDGERLSKIAASDTLGRRVDFGQASVARIAPVGQDKKAAWSEVKGCDSYYVPNEYRLISVGERISMIDEERVREGLQVKRAQDRGDKTVVIRSGSRYRITGREAAKLAAAQKDLTRDELMLFMATYGAPRQAQEETVAHMEKSASVTILGLDWSSGVAEPEEPQKVARDQGQVAEVLDLIGQQRPIFWKIASDYAELAPYMTDTALSLDIAEENQIDYFVDQVPVLEEAIKTCAQLLVQARIGNIDMVAEEVRDAMISMEKVFHALRGLDAE